VTATVIVIAKRPVPGRVKTRLTPPLRPDEAADVAAAALSDTLSTVSASPADRRVLAFDGDPTGWTPAGWTTVPQPSGSLDRRLERAFACVQGPALLVGMDTPQLTPAHLDSFDPMRYDACLGPATDGGYWAIGFRDARLAQGVIAGVPMSKGDTAQIQLERLQARGLRVQTLAELTDVDTIESAHQVARAAPRGAFARTLSAACAALDLRGVA
jgi:glycosyltransferase A (GT-A) superfamily protein (DUF2064 family)